MYTTEIHTDNNKICNPLKLKHCSEGASDRLLYQFLHMPPKEGLNMKGRDSKNSIEELDFAIETIFANKLLKKKIITFEALKNCVHTNNIITYSFKTVIT